MTLDEFISCMEIMALCIPRHAPSDVRGVSAIWFDEFKGLSANEFLAITKEAGRRYDSFPSMRQISILIHGDPLAEADLIAEKIWNCIGLYGSNSLKLHRVKETLGPLGWKFVEYCGGWHTFLSQAEHNDMGPTLKAQWRQGIKAMVVNGSSERDTGQSALPPSVASEIEKLADRFSIGPSSRPQTRADD